MSMIELDAFRMIFQSKKDNPPGGLLFNGDREVLLGLISAFKPRNFLEIGVYQGKTSKMILDASPWIEKYVGVDLLNPRQIHSEEPYAVKQQVGVGTAGFLAKSDSRFSMIELDGGAELDISSVYPMDMVFIDGDHSFESVRRDTEKARQVLRDGNGVIVWHDFGNPSEDVTRYIVSVNVEQRICLVQGSYMCFEIIGNASFVRR